MAYLTRDDVFGKDDRGVVDVEVPEWGGTIKLREMSAAERDAYELEAFGEAKTEKGKFGVRAALVRRCAVDADLKPLFPYPDDLEPLSAKSAIAMKRVFAAAVRLNGMGPDAEEQAAKKSEPGQPEGPPSV